MMAGFQASAQDVHQLLGKAINDREVDNFISELQDYEESFLPYAKIYKITSWSSGVELEFNSDFVVSKVSLYDSGYRFSQFKGQLPFKVQWGWDSTQVQNITNYLIFNEKNNFIKSFNGPGYWEDYYFRNNQLELIRITTDTGVMINASKKAVLQAFGTRLYPTGKKKSGNILDGYGTMHWAGGDYRYEGEWSYGVPHGKGTYIDSAGNTYQGEFKLGFFWGDGVYKTKTYTYDGEFVMGKIHGEGAIEYANGVNYSGTWFQGTMDGYGTYRLNASNYYVGDMANNTFNGKGVLYTKDGFIKGTFKDGKPHGYCVQHATESGISLKGNWVNGSKEGEFIRNMFGYDAKVYFKNDIEVVSPEEAEN
ncbi:hypothetical protein GYB29_05390 [bacterium]|nr:hypothetical protein [bacterium]